ncbi:MAG TPA: dihydrolipoamide acetyltransferase family protein [Spirochaetia bacterium]|nr:dihydrolipoamide acetyltransferase family protein [Spirochaetia bacterium]
MATEVLMPRQGQSVESCLILAWKKNVGESVAKGDAICEVETDKATFEVEAGAAGVLLARLFKEGDDVPVLTPIAYIGQPGEKVPSGAGAAGSSLPNPTASEAVAPPSSKPRGEPAASASRAAAGEIAEPEQRPATSRTISPRARNLAQAKGVKVEEAHGSGPGGRIIERDIKKVLESREPMTPAAISDFLGSAEAGTPGAGTGPGGRIGTKDLNAQTPAAAAVEGQITERPVKGIRKLIAERMHASLRDTAQLTMSASADARAMLSYRKRLKGSAVETLAAVTINDLVLFAVARTLARHPEMNAHMAADMIREFRAVHLGFAVDTPRGLIVPVIRDAHLMTLTQLSAEAKLLSQACLAGNVGPDDLAGATFTVSNLGNLGVESFTPVLNPPQVAILGVCAIQPKPVMNGEEVQFVPSIGLSITIDHRAVDGAPGARFLQDLAAAIRDIDLTLAL